MKFLPLFFAVALLPGIACAGEWEFDVSGHVQGLYGYTDVAKRFEHKDKNNHGVGQGDVSFSAARDYDNDYRLSLHLDLMGGIDQELADVRLQHHFQFLLREERFLDHGLQHRQRFGQILAQGVKRQVGIFRRTGQLEPRAVVVQALGYLAG